MLGHAAALGFAQRHGDLTLQALGEACSNLGALEARHLMKLVEAASQRQDVPKAQLQVCWRTDHHGQWNHGKLESMDFWRAGTYLPLDLQTRADHLCAEPSSRLLSPGLHGLLCCTSQVSCSLCLSRTHDRLLKSDPCTPRMLFCAHALSPASAWLPMLDAMCRLWHRGWSRKWAA